MYYTFEENEPLLLNDSSLTDYKHKIGWIKKFDVSKEQVFGGDNSTYDMLKYVDKNPNKYPMKLIGKWEFKAGQFNGSNDDFSLLAYNFTSDNKSKYRLKIPDIKQWKNVGEDKI